MFLKQLPSDSILAAIFYHYERRREWIYGYSGNQSMRAGLNELELAQRVVRHAIFSKWQLYGRPGEYGCCRTWLTHAITVCIFDRNWLGNY
jgi:pyridoxal/pyridoxine/pyridoxamine kinase